MGKTVITTPPSILLTTIQFLRPFRMYLLMAVVPITMALSLFEANANSIPEERADWVNLKSFDCTALPTSPNGSKFGKGCKGAVWSTGNPSEDYCTNTGWGAANNDKKNWYKYCCDWKNGKCAHSGCLAKSVAGNRCISLKEHREMKAQFEKLYG